MDISDIKKLSELARVRISAEEERVYVEEIRGIIEYVENIQEVTESIDLEKKLSTPSNVMRSDKNPHTKGKHTKDVLGNAPDTQGDYLRVKKIL